MPHFRSFTDLMQNGITPHKAAHRDWVRLDGGIGGNRGVFATFDHAGSKWRVHMDSYYYGFDACYKFDPTGAASLVVGTTRNGKRCLVPSSTVPLPRPCPAPRKSAKMHMQIFEV